MLNISTIRKMLIIGMAIVLIVFDSATHGQYSAVWFTILWVGLNIAALWISIRPSVQLVLIGAFVMAALFATEWFVFSARNVIQWGMVLWTLPFYAEGLRWGWNILRQRTTPSQR